MDPRHDQVGVRFLDEEQTLLVIDWADGHESVYPVDYLRGWCPCANCQGHGGESSFIPVDSPRLAGLSYAGNYALSMSWKDGHSTGIYPWERLREWCPCADCGGGLDGTPPEALASLPS
ncbi:MAG: DUF971 domain-containing protein [Acidobacteriota bacterium]